MSAPKRLDKYFTGAGYLILSAAGRKQRLGAGGH
jgi:hypothetical protein